MRNNFALVLTDYIMSIQDMIKDLAAQHGPLVAPGRSAYNSFTSATIQLTPKQSGWMISCGASFKDAHVDAIMNRKDFDNWVKFKKDFILATGSAEEGPISGTLYLFFFH